MRLARGLAAALVAMVAVAVLAAAALLFTAHTERGEAFLRPHLERLLARALDARVAIGRLELPALGAAVLHEVIVSFDGQSVIRAARADVRYGVPGLRTLAFRRIGLDRVAAHLVLRDGRLGPRPPRRDGEGRTTVRIDDLEVRDARIGIALADRTPPRRFVVSDVALEAALALRPETRSISVGALRATPRGRPLDPVTIAGRIVHRDDGRLVVDHLTVESTPGRIAGRLAVAREGGIELDARAEVRSASALAALASGLRLPADTAASLTARGPLDDVRAYATVSLAGAGRLVGRSRLDVSRTPFSYRAAVATTRLEPAALDPAWRSPPIRGAVHARGRGDRHAAHGRLQAAGAGRLAWRADVFTGAGLLFRAHGRGEVTDLRRLAGGARGDFPFRIDAGGSRARPGGAPHLRVSVEVGAGTIAGATVLSGAANAHLESGILRVRALRVATGAGVLAGDGVIDLARRRVEADLEARLEDGATVRAAATVDRRDAAWRGRIHALEVSEPRLGVWRSDGAGTFEVRDGVRVDGLRLSSGSQQASLVAAVGKRRLDGRLTLSGLDLASWCALANAECSGRASGTVEASGTRERPRFTLDAAARGIAIARLRDASLEARLEHEDGRARGEIRFEGAGGAAVLGGSAPAPVPGLPAARSDALDLRLTARRFNLRRLAVWLPGVVTDADGRARADLQVAGTWEAPRPSGTVTVRASTLELAASGAIWNDAHLALRADGGALVTVERLTARSGEGTLTGSGTLDFTDGLVPRASVRLRFDRFLAVERPVLDAACTGGLRIEGPLAAATIRGRLEVTDAVIRPAFLPATDAPDKRDPTIVVVGVPEELREPVPAPQLGGLALAVTLELGEDVRIRRRDADIELEGAIRVERTPPGPLTAVGTVKIASGWYTFQGRRFTLRGGSIRFDGGPLDGAKVDVEASHRAGDYDVTVAISGTLRDPVLLLSSDPPLDEADVLAVLVVGRPSGELDDEERRAVQAEAASLALGYVVPGLGGGGGGVADALGLESIAVSPEELRVSRRVGHDVFISLSQQFVGWAGQTVGIEYEITRRFSIELSTSTRGSGAIDVFWRRRY